MTTSSRVGVKEHTMTKSELIETVANKLKLPKGKAELIVNCVFDSMEASLKRGERIEIRGFGSFEIRSYKSYEGRNPRTGTKVEVRPKRLPFFKVGKELKERVNDGQASASPTAPSSLAERIPTAPSPSPVGDSTIAGPSLPPTTTAGSAAPSMEVPVPEEKSAL
jgi:integration host factor subunit beta